MIRFSFNIHSQSKQGSDDHRFQFKPSNQVNSTFSHFPSPCEYILLPNEKENILQKFIILYGYDLSRRLEFDFESRKKI